MTRAEVEATIGRSVFELVKVEDFLRDHNLYILKARRQIAGWGLGRPGIHSRTILKYLEMILEIDP
jgi:hypothetical protein